jgi:hypothetical protein
LFDFDVFNHMSKSIKPTPAGRVPPDAILLSGNKSMQKCLLLAEGYGRSRRGNGFKEQQRRQPARCRGPRRSAVNMGCPDHADEADNNQKVWNLKPFFYKVQRTMKKATD